MNAEEAAATVIRPYITEKTFAMVEKEAKVCFIVERSATKAQVVEAIGELYGQKAVGVNTTRTIYGKKAFVKFETAEKARDLATKIGML